jgi:uncharacterized protein (TIGR03086 family)
MVEPVDLTTLSAADRHRAVASTFGALVRSAADWSAPSPVAEWSASDVVIHLLDWFPEFLAAGGVRLREVHSYDADRLAVAWEQRTDEIQTLLDDSLAVDRSFSHPVAGTHTLGDAIDRFYTTDVFMHTWDLARAVGGDDRLDPVWSRQLLASLRPIEQLLRSSGHYGSRVDVDPDAGPVDQLMGFVGRDPSWTRDSRASGRAARGGSASEHGNE